MSAFSQQGNFDSKIFNKGVINATKGGNITLAAPIVHNEGDINAPMGTVAILSGNTFTLDENISFKVDKEIAESIKDESGKNPDLIKNSGTINADGGTIILKASAVDKIVNNAVNNEGVISAKTSYKDGNTIVFGTVDIDAGKNLVSNTGTIKATGDSSLQGGNISIKSGFAGIGGNIDVSGKQGGSVSIQTGTLSLADSIKAKGSGGKGGSVEIYAQDKTWETSSSIIDVSGKTGGSISNIAGKQITSSGTYIATGSTGKGGDVSISGNAVKLLSAQIDASGYTGGGKVLIGGEYQGGKGLAFDEIPNANTLAITSGTTVKANATGKGDGGTIISWADEKAAVFGTFSALPKSSDNGGFIEISSGNDLIFGGKADAGKGGTFLPDPKNITIADVNYSQYSLIMGYNYNVSGISENIESDVNANVESISINGNRMAVGSPLMDGYGMGTTVDAGAVMLYTFSDDNFNNIQLEASIGAGYTGGKNIDQPLDGNDQFGYSVSLDGNRLAVGAPLDDGFNNLRTDSGAVYLYSFSDSLFSGGNLESIIGHGYTGGKNVNQTLDTVDQFGSSVSLDGNRLAVGAYRDDGFNTIIDSGAVYLYSFSDSLFSGGNLESIIGHGYSGGKNIDQPLGGWDYFGYSVSLDGNRLAVGAYADDGFNNTKTNTGAVYLYSFSDSLFSGGNLESIIGHGYTGGKNINLALDNSDQFGFSLSLDGNRLAIGANGDDGFNNSRTNPGAVYLYSFTDNFSDLSLEGQIGYGYTYNKSIHTTLDGELFGKSVSLDGNKLGVVSNNNIYLYSFEDSYLNGGKLEYRIGSNLPQVNGIDPQMNISLLKGEAVSINSNRIAIGSQNNDGYSNRIEDSGAVFLYSYTQSDFSDINFESVIGQGYTGGKNINVALESGDLFGSSVSLNGNRLAVGAIGDDGFNNAMYESGAVYLFSFSDSLFSGGNLESIIGHGYTGGKNINLTLDYWDNFGSSVSLDADRLAVGASRDSGFNNAKTNSGAVYLYSFSDSVFSGGTLQGILGHGYTGGKNINMSLDSYDNFGSSVSLSSNRLAIGASKDDGFDNLTLDSGAVYLYSFSDPLFSGGNLESIIGKGYTGGKNIDLALESDDYFGSSVSLDADRIAIGYCWG
ncbi:MAG: hypothetical protein MZU84_03645 [Sphingobacterium sp.]|nr:hypothetical protein [Sphingobacterium sp.]